MRMSRALRLHARRAAACARSRRGRRRRAARGTARGPCRPRAGRRRSRCRLRGRPRSGSTGRPRARPAGRDRCGRARGARGSRRACRAPARAVAAHVVAAPGRFVDVVAEERDEVGLVGGDVAVGAEVALLVLLAGGEGEAHARAPLCRRRGAVRVRPTRAVRVAGGEAVPVPALGLEPVDLDVDRMRPLRLARAPSPERSTDLERLVGGELPSHRHRRPGRAHRSSRVHSTTPSGTDSPTPRRARTDTDLRAGQRSCRRRQAPRVCRKRRRVEHANRITASLELAMIHFVVHEEGDGVGVVVVEGVKSGQTLAGWIMEDDKDIKVTAKNDIPIGHKLALSDYKRGRHRHQVRRRHRQGGEADRARASICTCITSKPSVGRPWISANPLSGATSARTAASACATTSSSCRSTTCRTPPRRRSRTTSRARWRCRIRTGGCSSAPTSTCTSAP